MIIGGHFRGRLAVELKIPKVPVVFVNIPNIEEEKKLNLRLNRTGGEFDFELLKEFDTEILLDTGFNDLDLQDIWDDTLGISIEEELEREQERILTSKEIITKTGDLWQLGDHRLLVGDATNPKDVQKLMGEEKAQMIYLDSPYQIGLDYNKGINGTGKYGGKEKDKRTDEEFEALLKNSLQNAINHSQKDAHVFMWCDQSKIGLIQNLYEELGVKQKRICLWIKNHFNLTPKIAFNKVYEVCVYGTIGNPPLYGDQNLNEILNQEIENGNRGAESIMHMLDLWVVSRIPTDSYEHPTQKPITLHEKPLKRCTKVQDCVVDLYGGSGSTMRACEQMKRKAFLMEIDPVFATVIIKLWEKMTDKKAVLISEIKEVKKEPDKKEKAKKSNPNPKKS